MHSNIRFLCPTHRNWVQSNPEQARDYINDILFKGSQLIKQEAYRDALPYMGCAMESIEILDAACVAPDAELLSILPCVANALAICFAEIGQAQMVPVIEQQARDKLEGVGALFACSGGKPRWLHKALAELADFTAVAAANNEQWKYMQGQAAVVH